MHRGAIPTTDFAKKASEKLSDLKDQITGVTGALKGLSSNAQSLFSSVADLTTKWMEGFKDDWKGMATAIGSMVSNAVNYVSGLFEQQTQNRLSQLDETANAEKEHIQNSTMSEQAKKKAIDTLDAQTAKKRKQLMREEAKEKKEVSIVQALIAGALAVVQALPNMILAGFVGALAAAETAAIIAQPLPALAKGGLAYGRADVTVGEYSGAKTNPEVISPLSKLKEMFGAGESGGELSCVVSGDNLLFVLNRAKIRQNRLY